MARKAGRIILIAVLILVGLMAGLVVGTECLLNSRVADRLVQKYASEYVDGDLAYSRLRISLFRSLPDVKLSIDSLSLTYPHERHSRWDVRQPNAYLQAGRGEVKDTLASFGRLDVIVNPFKLRQGRIEARKLHLDGLRAYVHAYPDSTANWQMIRIPESSDTSSTVLPWIDVTMLSVSGPSLVYTAQGDAIYAKAAWNSLDVKGSIKVAETMTLDKLRADLVAARVAGALGTLCADASFDLSADSDGTFGSGEYPETAAALELNACRVDYLPMKLRASLSLAADARMDRSGAVDADVEDLAARTEGLRLHADGFAKDVLGGDPRFGLRADADVLLDSLVRFLPADAGIALSGLLDMDLDASGKLSDVLAYRFQNTDIKGHVLSDRLEVSLPADTLDVNAFRPRLAFVSGGDGLDLDLDVDSLALDKGADIKARVRNMTNCGKVFLVDYDGTKVPRLELDSDNERLFVAAGSNRAGARSANIMLAAEKRLQGASRRHHARSAADSTARRRSRYVSEGDFASHDIKVALDSTINNYLNQWRPSGRISIGKGFFASPALPLRTRLNAFEARFSDYKLDLDTLSVSSGSSDVAAKGSVRGIRPFMSGRGVLDMNLDVQSDRLNINEIVAAFQDNKGASYDASDEEDESFVTDAYSDAVVDTVDFGLIVIPGNIAADLRLLAREVDYTDFVVLPLKANAKVQDRTLQLLDTRLSTNYGQVGLDAYYSTKSRSDISAGVDVRISEVSANQLIHMLPAVDEMLPAIKTFQGKLSCDVSATTKLDNHMNVLMPTVDGLVRISGKDLCVQDAGDLRKITRLLLFKDKNIGRIDDLTVDAVVHDSKLEVFPFELGVDRYRMALHGRQGFDGSMNYHLSLLKSPYLLLFGINMYGTLDNWRFSLGRARYRDGKVPAYTQKIDSVQVNIGRSIRDIFRLGVDNARRYNVDRISALGSAAGTSPLLPESDDLPADQMAAIDDLLVDDVMRQLNSELEQEVNDAVQEALLMTGDLMSEYESLTYDRNLDRKMSRLKEQSRNKKK